MNPFKLKGQLALTSFSLLFACAARDEHEALAARVAALEAQVTSQQAEIETLRSQQDIANERSKNVSEIGASSDPCAEGVPQELSSLQFFPHRGPTGEIDGLRITALRRGSPFACAGLKNGDVLQRSRGQPLRDPEQARAALEGDPSTWDLDLVRRGQPLHLPEGA